MPRLYASWVRFFLIHPRYSPPVIPKAIKRKDHYFSRDLQLTIPVDYYFNGLPLTGLRFLGRCQRENVAAGKYPRYC